MFRFDPTVFPEIMTCKTGKHCSSHRSDLTKISEMIDGFKRSSFYPLYRRLDLLRRLARLGFGSAAPLITSRRKVM